MKNFYKQDLAYVHHVGFGQFSKNVGNELIKIFRKNGINAGLVIDLGCGTGLWADILLNKGYSVFGSDISEEMTRIARETAPLGEFVTSSLYEIDLRPCVAVTAVGEVLNYCAESEPSLHLLDNLFQKIAGSLHDRGIFAFDVIVESDNDKMQYRTWNKGNDWVVLVEVSETPAKKELMRDITVFRQVEQNYRRSEEQHRCRILSRETLTNLLENNGFDVTVSAKYGDYPLAPRRLAFIARKTKIG